MNEFQITLNNEFFKDAMIAACKETKVNYVVTSVNPTQFSYRSVSVHKFTIKATNEQAFALGKAYCKNLHKL